MNAFVDASDLETVLHQAKALIFDCDGTLVKTPCLYATGWKAAFRKAGLDMEPAWYRQREGLSEHILMDEFEAEHGVILDRPQTVKALRNSLLENIGTLREIEEVTAIARAYKGSVPMAVASGGSRQIVRASLEATGLLTLFDTVVTIDDVSHPKPAPDLFQEAAHRLGVTGEACLVFEDSPQGHQAAAAAGMKSIDVMQIRRLR
ncbi:HAD family phosphatase [Roseibium sp. MMSF_3544]|uniref:HAD family hydrolase n=1 Tax=unclassified Roseibium TaxID=2629323 RepID=UPI00273D5239|nr:HAD family phosphatase [Roseibium sp. MMSF_3544]